MAHRKTRRHSRRRKSRNIVNQGVTMVKSTSQKYMPKVKTGLENVGSRVVQTGEKTVPFLQRLTRKVFSKFGLKSKSKSRSRR